MIEIDRWKDDTRVLVICVTEEWVIKIRNKLSQRAYVGHLQLVAVSKRKKLQENFVAVTF